MGLRPLKKSVYAQEQDAPRIQQLRQAYQQKISQIEPWQWVFVDETWFNTQMSRYWGWAEKGEKIAEAIPPALGAASLCWEP